MVDASREKSLELVDKQLLESVEDNSDEDDDDEEDDGEDDDSEEYLYDDEEDDDESDDGDLEESSEEKAKSDKVTSPKMECSEEEYKRLKNNLLLYHCARIGDSDCTEEFTRKGGFSCSCFNLKGSCSSSCSLYICNFCFLFHKSFDLMVEWTYGITLCPLFIISCHMSETVQDLFVKICMDIV